MSAQPDFQLSPKQARARLNVSRTIFDAKYRPQLTEHRHGPRTVRFSSLELDALLAETAAPKDEGAEMFGRRTVKDALDHAWRAKWKDSKGARKKAQLMKVVNDEMGKRTLSSLDYNAMEEWVMRLNEMDKAPATIRSRVSCLTFALGLAVKKGWMKAVPPVPEIGTPKHKLRWLTDAEVKLLLSACDTQRYQIADVMRDVITVLLDTGCRVGELIKVRDDSISVRGKMTYVEFLDRKAGDDLTIPLTAEARDALYRLVGSRYWMDRVRGTRQSAKRLNSAQNWITHRFTEIRDAAGLPDVTAHSLRHTCASRLVQSGISLYMVSKMLGHSSVRVTERYSHFAPNSLHEAVEALERRTLNDKVAKMSDYRKGE